MNHLKNKFIKVKAKNIVIRSYMYADDLVYWLTKIAINSEIGTVHNLTRNETYVCEKLPSQLLDILKHGGLIPHLEKMLKEKEQMDQSIREETNK